MIVVNGLKACDTCRKAMRALAAAGIDARLRDLRAEPPTAAEVSGWYDVLGDMMLNRRSTTWRTLPEADKTQEPVTLMVARPTLIKRPVVDAGGQVFLGWTAETQRAAGL